MVCTKCSKQRDQSYESNCRALQNMLAMLSWLPSPNATDSNVDDYPCCDNTAVLQENLHISLPNIFDKLFATSSMAVKGLQTKSQAHVKLTFAHLNSHPAHQLVSSPINLTRILSPPPDNNLRPRVRSLQDPTDSRICSTVHLRQFRVPAHPPFSNMFLISPPLAYHEPACLHDLRTRKRSLLCRQNRKRKLRQRLQAWSTRQD